MPFDLRRPTIRRVLRTSKEENMVRMRFGFPVVMAVAVLIAALGGDFFTDTVGYYWGLGG